LASENVELSKGRPHTKTTPLCRKGRRRTCRQRWAGACTCRSRSSCHRCHCSRTLPPSAFVPTPK
jgi:hypothetical protein